jgi:hypothetical protein
VRPIAVDRDGPFEDAFEALKMNQREESEERMQRRYLSVMGQGECERAHGAQSKRAGALTDAIRHEPIV